MFREAIIAEQKRNQRLIDLSAASAGPDGVGSLALEKRGNQIYCYEQVYQGKKRVRKTYLGTPDSEAAHQHLQNRLKKEQVIRLQHNQKVLAGLEEDYLDCGPEALLDALPMSYGTIAMQSEAPERALMFDRHYEAVKQWAAGGHERNTAPFSEASTYAKDGTRVRSKGECIYYNMLLDHGVINVYDCYMTFRMRNGKERRLCPDFVIKCLDGRMIIIEHFGRLDDMQYCIDTGQKLYWYTHCGFVLGQNLFVTGDDARGGTDSRAILEVVRKVERMFYGY